MFEMFLTIMAALIAAIYGVSQSVFMNGPHRNYYRIGLLVLILIIYGLYKIHHTARQRHLKRLHVEPEAYVYYAKYTSLLYRAGYFISYFIQNILFDYIYMWRNFNFCKGLDVYDGGRRRILHQVPAYLVPLFKADQISPQSIVKEAAGLCRRHEKSDDRGCITDRRRKERYLHYAEEAKNYFDEHGTLTKSVLKSFANYGQIDWYYRKNILKNYKAIACVRKYQPLVIEMVRQKEDWNQKDLNEFRKKEF